MFGRPKSTNQPSKTDYYGLSYIVMERPGHTKIVNTQSGSTSQESYIYHILYTFSHAFQMQKEKRLTDDEWNNWLNLMRSTFQSRSITTAWSKDSDLRQWFDPLFCIFISQEILPLSIPT